MKNRKFTITDADAPLIAKLSPEHQQMLARNKSSTATIAAELDLPEGTVKSRMHRARNALEALRPANPA